MQHAETETGAAARREPARPPEGARCEAVGGSDPWLEIFSRRSRACGQIPAVLSDAVRRAIARFSPRNVPPAVWAEIQLLVQDWVAHSAPTDAEKVSAAMGIVAQLLLWVRGNGEPLEADLVLHPEMIDRFLVEGCHHLGQGTRLTYRTHLRRVGEAVLGPTLYPPRSLKMAVPKPALPYKDAEIAAQLSWTRGLPSERMRRNAGVLLSLGLGAGLDATEMARLRGSDVTRDTLGVLVHVSGRSARSVPVLRSWEDKVFVSAQEVGDHYVFRPDRHEPLRHQTSNFISRCAKVHGEPPAFSIQRLRTTWIVRQLAARVPPKEVARLAGTRAVQLAKYFDFLPDHDEAAVRLLARDAATP